MTDPLRDELQVSLGTAYTIDRELGGGGMSHVFVATETSLNRSVVIKLLAPELAAGVSAERFAREVRLVAALQQANIVPVHAAGEAAGLPYYTMPFIDGLSLRARLARETPMPVAEIVSVLRDVARALAYAHERGVIHRDIKPDNILLSGDAAMVTDFGIAKALAASRSQAPGGTLTQVGTSLGTPAYMSPEQAAGDPHTDARSDIYAFGCVAYEMLTGKPPFHGRPPHQLFAAHMTEAPVSVAKARPDCPPVLAELVMQCLEKNSSTRPQSARELLDALDRTTTPAVANARSTRAMIAAIGVVVLVAAGGVAAYSRAHRVAAAPAGPRSIAVLPFENGSRDTAYDYFAEGLSDEVRSRLTGLAGISVKPRASSAQFHGANLDPRAVGTKLGVSAVLSGVVRRSGDRIQVTTDLADATTGDAIWSHTFDQETRDVALVRDSIAGRIAATLRASLTQTAAGGRPPSARETADFDAYDSFLKGQYAYRRFDFQRAATLFANATQRDPTFLRAFAALTLSYVDVLTSGVGSRDSMIALARASRARAIALDSSSSYSKIADAAVLQLDYRFAETNRILEQILEHEPENLDVLMRHGFVLFELGRVDESRRAYEAARRIDPLNPNILVGIQYMLVAARRFREAIAAAKPVFDLDPISVLGYGNLGEAYAFAGKTDSAVTALERAARFDSTGFGVRPLLAFTYAAAGRWRDVDRVRAEVARAPLDNSPNYNRMLFAIIDGDIESALTAFERMVTNREPVFLGTSPCDPLFDPIATRPEYARLVQSSGGVTCPVTGPWPISRRPH